MLDRAGFQGRALGEVVDFAGGWFASACLLELGGELAEAGGDCGIAARERGDQTLWDTDDFADRALGRIGCGAFGELDTHQVLHMVFQAGVVDLRHGDHRLVDRGAIEGAPFAVERADPVGDHHVGVQVRIPGTAVAMGETGGDDALDIDLAHTVAAEPGEHRIAFEPDECVAYRALMRELDLARYRPRSQRPQHRDALDG